MTPIIIQTLLAVYAQVIPTLNYEGIRQSLHAELLMGPGVRAAIGVVTCESYTLTARGKAFVVMLLDTPLPKFSPGKWIDPRGLEDEL